MKRERILITGASGFVGRNVKEHFNQLNYDVLAPSSKELNCIDENAVKSYLVNKKVDIVLHFAVYGDGIDKTKDGTKILEYNLRIFLNFAKYSDLYKKMIYTSGKDNLCGHRFDSQYGELPLGYDHKYVYSHFGYNLKATDMQAAIGCAQLEKFPGFVEKRKYNFNRLWEGLKELQDKLILPQKCENSDPSWFGFALTCKEGVDRNKVVPFIESKGIQTRMLFAGNLTKHPCFDEMRQSKTGYRVVGELENTDRIMNDTFWLGVYPGMTEEKIDYMIKAVKEAVLVDGKMK